MERGFRKRAIETVRDVLPRTLKTCIWIIEITVGVSFVILFLRYFNFLPWISSALAPVFGVVGLPGEAALAYVSGYFVNVYSAIAVAVTIGLDSRATTILAVLVLCSHNMIVETAVQKKTGTSAARIIIIRTISGIIIAMFLNLILPKGDAVPSAATQVMVGNPELGVMFFEWLRSMFLLVIKMVVIIFSLNILQSLLAEFGVIRWISKFLKPLLAVFGLPARCSLLWIIANIVGLAYGAAAMIDETQKGKLSKRDIDLVNIHISISHSNLEDLILFSSIGAVWWVLVLSRWVMSIILVWGYRLELALRNKFLPLRVK